VGILFFIPLSLVSKVHKSIFLVPYGPYQLTHFVVLNTNTNKVVRIIGKSENIRFLNIALYQGNVESKKMLTMVTTFDKAYKNILNERR
jgi:hypothetical protein